MRCVADFNIRSLFSLRTACLLIFLLLYRWLLIPKAHFAVRAETPIIETFRITRFTHSEITLSDLAAKQSSIRSLLSTWRERRRHTPYLRQLIPIHPD